MSEPLSFRARVQDLLSEPLARQISERPMRRKSPLQAVADARMKFLNSEKAQPKEQPAPQAIVASAKVVTAPKLQLLPSPIPGQIAHISDPVLAHESTMWDLSAGRRHFKPHGRGEAHARLVEDEARAREVLEFFISEDAELLSGTFITPSGAIVCDPRSARPSRRVPEVDHLLDQSAAESKPKKAYVVSVVENAFTCL